MYSISEPTSAFHISQQCPHQMFRCLFRSGQKDQKSTLIRVKGRGLGVIGISNPQKQYRINPNPHTLRGEDKMENFGISEELLIPENYFSITPHTSYFEFHYQ